MILLMHCLFVRMAGAAFTPRQDQPPPSMWPRSQRRRRSPSGCSGCPGGAGAPASHMSLGCLAVRTKALPRRRRLSPRVHHITASRTTPARLTRVPLTFIYTAHTTSLTSPPATRTARFHSTARAPADTFLVPARSPRKTRPSRRPPRSARPLVRPTSFMRTTPPRPPPAKALRNSRFNLRFSSRCDLRPKSRPLRPAATQDQHDSPATLNSARTPPAGRTHHNGRAAGH